MSERTVVQIKPVSRGKLLAFVLRPGMTKKYPKHAEAVAEALRGLKRAA